jgi:RNA polymerase sigma factor (sigma-70 family)
MAEYFEATDDGPTLALLAGGRAEDDAVELASDYQLSDSEFATLYDEWAPKLHSFTYAMLRSHEDAEDAVQTTFLNAYRSLQNGEQPRNVGSWLFCIARNVCLNRIRTSRRKPSSSLESIEIAAMRGVEDELERHLHARALRFAIQRLPEQQRLAIVMRELQGASYHEIADALDTTQGAVESLLFRARRTLARSLRAQVAHAGAPGTLRAAA